MIVENVKKSKFSFSRKSESEETCKLEQFKNKLQGDVLQFLKNTKQDDQSLQMFLQRLGIILEGDEETYILDIKEYHNKYIEGDVLGEGCIGLVKSVKRRSDGFELACKTVKTDSEEIVKKMIMEFKNLRRLNHPHIVSMKEIYIQWFEGFQSTGMVCVIMEKIEGREMFEVIQQQKQYSGIILTKKETIARVLFIQILEAIKYMHENYCCHRDLKPNNILCAHDGKSIKITDFNFNDRYKEFGDLNQHGKIEMWTYTGTVAFSAPEIFSGNLYNEQVDLWSAGVILYVMLSGELPFNQEYLNDLIEQIRQCKYEFTGIIWDQISESAKDLITNLLQLDPEKRFTPEQALNHPWITHEQSNSDIPRYQLQKNMARILRVKNINQESRIKQICYLFGAGDIWKRHSLGQDTNLDLYDNLKKYRSIDISDSWKNAEIKVTKDTNKKGVYTIDYPFSDSD
ncbi:unnamed protein product (macronuclear) [Paramecium tetraurelia]|uniref:Protein kinase domain-containing protein n=1 Tax=Paramecium tetraurelia TaxID=5888 RepID=A0DCJ5_PARTE|nr:uncharacterized protein GSPATT00015640001 [Paramecium tetraurelia]CAK80762.1 unnamed protein product [Paramecium tetraurelia]|eukprot:XP_001448159.1 hypothetical protein (macronuclear) [Paramecium tetraurelia strain d4-2]